MKNIVFAALLMMAAHVGLASNGNNGASTTNTNSVSVTGTVVDANTKKPLADVTVVAVNANKQTETVTTNAQGQFRIVTLPQGTYTLRFTRDEYKSCDKKDVIIKNETTTKITIEMVAETLENNSHRSWWDKFDLYL